MFAYPQYPSAYPSMPSMGQPMQTMSAMPNPMQMQLQMMEMQMQAMRAHIESLSGKTKTRKPRAPKDPNAPPQAVPSHLEPWHNYVRLIQSEMNARMKAVDPTYKGATWNDAMKEAKRLKEMGDPRYQYQPKAKASVVAPVQPSFASLPFPAPAPASAPAPAIAHTPTTKKLVKATKPAPAPVANPFDAFSMPTANIIASTPAPLPTPFSLPFPTPQEPISVPVPAPAPSPLNTFSMTEVIQSVPTQDETDLVLEEETINGITYLMSEKKECWLMDQDGSMGAWAGVFNGTSIDDSIPEPSY